MEMLWRNRSRLLLAMLTFCVSFNLKADVTITEHTSGHAGRRNAEGQRITFIKASKLRIETTQGNDTVITIYDLDAGKKTRLKTKQKEAEVRDFTVSAAQAEKKVPSQNIKASIEPTGQRKQILGRMCEEYSYEIRVPAFEDPPLVLQMTGTTYIAVGVQGTKDYEEFVHAARKRGLILGLESDNPLVVALDRAQTEVYHLVSGVHGLPFATDSSIRLEGGFLARVANKIIGAGMRSSNVTALSTDPIADEEFSIPAGWKVRTK